MMFIQRRLGCAARHRAAQRAVRCKVRNHRDCMSATRGVKAGIPAWSRTRSTAVRHAYALIIQLQERPSSAFVAATWTYAATTDPSSARDARSRWAQLPMALGRGVRLLAGSSGWLRRRVRRSGDQRGAPEWGRTTSL